MSHVRQDSVLLPPPALAVEPPQLLRGLRHRFGRLPFRSKLVLATTSISFLCLMLAGLILAANEVSVVRGLLLNRSLTLADVVAANSEAVLSFEDHAGAEQLLANLSPEPTIDEARILIVPAGSVDEPPKTFARFVRSRSHERPLPDFAGQSHRFLDGVLHVIRPVMRGDERIGDVYLRVELSQLDGLLLRFAAVIGVLMLATMLLSWSLARRLQGSITRPVTELLQTTETVRQFKDYSVRARVVADDELGSLTRAVNAMLAQVQAHDAARAAVEQEIRELNEQLENKVRDRTQDLQASNLDLQEAIDSLRRAQGQLVESEKMAALGGLVAGVAHEINTPLGICVTVSSHLGDKLYTLKQAFARGIRRTDLESFISDGEQALSIVDSNLGRAADLVRSFKRVAVDQGSEERRRFKAAEYFSEVLTSLSPKLKRNSIEVELDCDPTIELDSYPGVFAQIVTNLAFNALIHAFDNHGPGKLQIIGRRDGGLIELSFADNGKGMTDDIRQRVFDPFFTTKRGDGGSGLGLHITYNQVTQQLAGTIRCESTPGEGTRFVLRFPATTPCARKAEPSS